MMLIYLIILTSQCVCVHSKVIIVNSNNGNDNTECCVNGECACSSLFTALLNIDNNTIINITSQSVALNNTTTVGSGKLTNITITGSNVTIMCNNSGSVYCESCDDVMIEGITWDRCGDPNAANTAGMMFNGTSNISLVNCTFQHSQSPAVSLLQVSDSIMVQNSNFLSCKVSGFAVFNVTRVSSAFSNNSKITVTINENYFYNNICDGAPPLYIHIDDNSVTNCNITFKKTRFISNQFIFFLLVEVKEVINILLMEISAFDNTQYFESVAVINSSSVIGDVFLSIISSTFNGNNGSNLWCSIRGNTITAMINNSNFTDSKVPGNRLASKVSPVHISFAANNISKLVLYRLHLSNNLIALLPAISNTDVSGAISIVANSGDFILKVLMVNFTSIYNKGPVGGALTVLLPYDSGSIHSIYIVGCNFKGNKSPGHGAALYIDTKNKNKNDNLEITNTTFDKNDASYSIVYLQGFSHTCYLPCPLVIINTSSFISNVGSSLYLSSCYVYLSGNLLFKNNTAENGGAMYIEQETTVSIDDGATVQFIANTAKLNGGAIYVSLVCSHHTNVGDYIIINTFNSDNRKHNQGNLYVIFTNNSARIADNALYFDVPRSYSNNCTIHKTTTDPKSIMYVPCKFNYSQSVNGEMTHISYACGKLLNGTGAPIVTSPHELRLYFPFSDAYIISSISHNYNVYFVRNNILGYEVKFTGAVFDYFGRPTIPTQFNIQLQCLQNTECSEYILISDNHNYILTHTIDNFTMLSVNFKGKRIDTSHINLNVTLTSLLYSYGNIRATIVVELVPCVDHPGYTYNEDAEMCVCYYENVKCSTDGNEIKRGYWFGTIADKATTSLCPNHYCEFTDRTQTTESYFELPNTINAQCNDHRVGRACGECSSGYTLSYDSTDCISVDQCGTGWTVLVITLTCLYWIAVVAGVFSLMYFRSKISLEYLYGLMYYYSMVGILLNNNPYVSDGAFWFASILSSFAQLTPQFLGKLCLMKNLSGIDQLFIHYSHAVGVSLLLLLIVVAVRYSARLSLFVSRCIIRVICLLILLSYTSIASTSLQLLLPLKFTDVKEWYTYSSPHIQYFHGWHIIYGAVAVICELVVGIGFPLLLLCEPVLSKRINFIKIKPLLDQLQGCYKDKYRWFAAYYLICRQVIFLIVYIFNSDYSNMLFYLQTACVVIAMIHMWIQPYRNEFLSAFDGVMLLCIVLEVNINTFPFLNSMTTEVSIVIVMLPLLLLSSVVIRKVFYFYLMKWRYYHYTPINDFVSDERVSDIVIRYVHVLQFIYIYIYILPLFCNCIVGMRTLSVNRKILCTHT